MTPRFILITCLATGLMAAVLMLPAPFIHQTDAQERKYSILESPLTMFQSIISKADGQRCPMYPTCSHYADQAVKRHGKIKGWLLTGDRLLRCGHDETRRSPEVLVNGARSSYDPLEANTFWWSKP